MGIVIKSSTACTDTSIPFAERDPLLSGTDGGIHLFDLSRIYGYPRQAAPLGNDLARDLARDQQNGYVTKRPAASLLYSGGGIDLNGTQTKPNGVVLPPVVWSDIHADGHDWLVSATFKLPTAANWPAVSGTTVPIFGALPGEFYPVTFFIVNSSGARELWLRRQTGVATFEDRVIVGADVHAGSVVQISAYRTATAFGYVINSAVGRVALNTVPGADDYGDWSSSSPVFGVAGNLSDATGIAYYQKIYRGFVEDLTVTGRNPVDVVDADWLRTGGAGLYA